MHIFLKELKSRRIGLLVWSVSMIGFMFMCMVKFKTLSTDSAGAEKLISQFPHTLQAVFGMSGLDITTLAGYYGVCFIFIMILVAVHAGTLGVNLIASEGQMKTTEFLYTKPATRARIITGKLCAGLVQLVVIWAATYLGSIWSIKSVTSMGDFSHSLAVFMAATAVVQVVFFAFGLLFAAIAKSANSPAKWMSGLVFGMYILSVIAAFRGYGALRQVSIFSYFNAPDILKTGSISVRYTVICSLVSLAAIAAAYIVYQRRDLTT